MESKISLRALEYCKYKGITAADFERISGLANGMLRKLGINTRKQTYIRISNAFTDLDVDWLRTGVGEMLNKSIEMNQNGNSGVRQQAKAGHDLHQTNNSEKLLEDFIGGIKSQNKLAEKAMEQTDRIIDQMGKTITEISEQRKLMDRLISIIENK